jgi:F0F1-type ATP synthase delta subunit
VDEQLIAGLTITLGSLVLDGSLATKVQRAARRAQASP